MQVAVSSLEMLDRQLDPSYISKSTLLPLLEVDLDLRNQVVVFMPPIAHTGPALPDNSRRKSVRELVQAMLDSFLGVGCVFKRLDTGEGNYLREIQVRALTCKHRAADGRVQRVWYEWRAESWMDARVCLYQDDPEVEVLLASIKGRVAEVERKADDYRKARTCPRLRQTRIKILTGEHVSHGHRFTYVLSGLCVGADAWCLCLCGAGVPQVHLPVEQRRARHVPDLLGAGRHLGG